MRGTKYCRQRKNVKITFILHYITDNFHTDHHLLWLLLGGLWGNWKRRKETKIPLLRIMLTYATFSKIPRISVCLICTFQKSFYVKKGNYLEFVWRCRFWRRTRRLRENRDFADSNIAKLAAPQTWHGIGTLEISVMTRYLDDHEQWRPKMLGVDAHLYRLVSPQI